MGASRATQPATKAAAGRSDGYVEHHIKSWDCLAGVLLVKEAGGYVSDFLAGEGLLKGNPVIACAPGVKDPAKLTAFFKAVQEADRQK